MGKFLDKFKEGKNKVENKLDKLNNLEVKPEKNSNGMYDDFFNDIGDEYPLQQQAQKPESFHRWVLDNQYRDLERSIRGIKDIWDKKQQKFISVRKRSHCFTQEEAEDILRTAESHLSSDIKLSYINQKTFGDYMVGLYNQFRYLFRSIAEYRYGRYGDEKIQFEMKSQNLKILIELWTRIQANYSRAIGGSENKATHDTIRGQESLNNSGNDLFGAKRYF